MDLNKIAEKAKEIVKRAALVARNVQVDRFFSKFHLEIVLGGSQYC